MRSRLRIALLPAALLAAALGWPGASGAIAAPAQDKAATIAAARWSSLTQTSFRHLRAEDGLPNEIATAVAEDGEGLLWIGTLGGLARWDGYRLRVYKADPRQPGALHDNFIQALHRDAAGRLWVASSGAGLARYDRATDRFVTLPVGPQGLAHVNVRALCDDGRGGLWVATDGGLHQVAADGAQIARVAIGAEGLPGARVQALLLDRLGRLWAGTDAGLFRRDARAERFTPIAIDGGGRSPEAQALYEDGGGRIWIGTLQRGVFRLDPGDAVARPVLDGGPVDPVQALRSQDVVAITEPRPGELWFGTVGRGIIALDAASGRTRRIRHLPALPVSLASDVVRAFHRDRSGQVWAATDKGVGRHAPARAAVLTMFGAAGCPVAAPCDVAAAPSGTEISWIKPTADGRLWLATHKQGVEVIDPAGGRIAALAPDPVHPATALPADIVLALEPAPDGGMFIATKRGLYRASRDARRVERVHLAGRDPSAPTWALLLRGRTLWIGGQADGVWTLDVDSGRGAPVLRDPARPLSDQRITVLAPAGTDGLWVGTRFGLNRVDPASGAVERIVPAGAARRDDLPAGFITHLMHDRRGRLWVGTYGGGIGLIDKPDQPRPAVRTLSVATIGLPDDNINALIEADDGDIWVSTDAGLARIDPKSFDVRALRRADGVEFLTYWTGAVARTDAGELLFGGAGGMSIVRPRLLATWQHRPAVVVTELKVGGRLLPVGAFDGPRGLEIPADANSLAVEFAALDYSAPERNRYAYRLDGYERDWVEIDATHRLASYANLPPGRYRLLLRGSNREGDWSEQPLGLALTVHAAWHQTLWFRAALFAAALALIALVVQLRTRWLRAHQRELEARVQERTAALERMSNALAAKSKVLELASISDPLTGLHNRRFLTEHIEATLAATLRRGTDAKAHGGAHDTDTLFFLIDLDHFKRINDLHGHAAGDQALMQVADRLRSVMRESDDLVRWGGEEFLAVAHDTDRARAEELAERIRRVVADTPLQLADGRKLELGCSIGFASLPFIAAAPRALGWQDVIGLADAALLAAKRGGRNAWVGLAAGPAAEAEGLALRAQADLAGAVERGELLMARSTVADATDTAPASD